MGGPGSRSPAFRPGSGPVARAEGHRIGRACPAVARLREGGSITRKFAELLGGTIGMEGAGVVSTMGTNGSREVLAPPPAGN